MFSRRCQGLDFETLGRNRSAAGARDFSAKVPKLKGERSLQRVPVFAMLENGDGLNGAFAYVLSQEEGTVE